MMKIKTLVLAILAVMTNLSLTAGGGWVHGKGSGYLKLSQWWVIADKHYTTSGLTDPNLTTGVLNTSIYGEYGITDRLEGLIYLPFIGYAFSNEEISGTTGQVLTPGESVTSIGDTDVGIKYGIIKDKGIVLSSYLWLGLPIGNNGGGSLGHLQTGDGEFNQKIGLVGSTGGGIFKGVNGFASLGVDYNNRSNGFSDELSINVELGASIKDKLILVYKLTSLKSMENGTTVAENPFGGLFSNNREYVSYTYEVGYNVTEKFGVTANYSGAYSAKLIFASPSYSVGVYMNF